MAKRVAFSTEPRPSLKRLPERWWNWLWQEGESA